MATITSHTTRATGTILTASIYNSDHVNHVTNASNLNTTKLEGATPPVVDGHAVLWLGTSAAALKSAGYVPANILRQITTAAGSCLTGGGDLQTDRPLALDVATQAEAEAGTATNKGMTPQRVQQAIQVLAPIPVGGLMPFGGATPPARWHLCNGQALNRTTYAALFAAIGTAYGAGNGSTTFNVPNMIGKVPGGVDASGTLMSSFGSLGAFRGAQSITLGSGEMPSHTHLVDQVGAGIGTTIGWLQSSPGDVALGTLDNGETSTSAGSGGAHDNVQPSLAFNFIIYSGVV